jgi:tetratricopeptide (TPR) repeat protein
MPETNTLVLEILRQEKGLKMSLFEQRELVSALRHYSLCPVAFSEIDKLCQEIVGLLNKISTVSNLSDDSVKDLSKAGQFLWDHLLTKPVKEKLKSTQIPNLILSLDEELVNIPWELLFDGRNFLCLNFSLGRLVHTKKEANFTQYRSFSTVPRMLILANPTNDLKGAYLEGVNIKNQFDRRRNNVHIDFKSTYIDSLYVKKNLYDYDIVHFAGHCEYDANNPKNTGWLLGDGKFSIQDILTMGSGVSLPSLVFSNACYSAKDKGGSLDEDYQERSYSLASAFLFAGTRHYLGAIRRIDDPVSFAFAKEFYAQLVSGKSIGECARLSRLKLIREYGIANIHWTSYILYGDPNFVLFKLRAKPQRLTLAKRLFQHKKRILQACLGLAAILLSIYLYMWLPNLNPNNYYLFSKSRKLYQKGSNEEVILLCNRIIQNDASFLAAYLLLADTYQRLGYKDMALKYYFDYARFSEKKQDGKNLACAYINIGWFYHLGGNYDRAQEFYHKVLNLTRKTQDKLNEAIALRKLAVWHIDKKNYGQALELLVKSSQINSSRLYSDEHRYNLACDYFDLGLLFIDKDDFSTARDFYKKARSIFEKLKRIDQLSDYYFNLGEVYLFEKEYQKALDCYLKGLSLDRMQANKLNMASDYNMIGELYLEMDNHPEAEKYFQAAVAASQEINAQPELAAAYYNLGLLYKKAGKKNRVREYFRQAQEIYKQVDEESYQKIRAELLALNN